MPTYEFRCPDGTIVERIFKMSDVPAEIPSPNGDGVATRMISGGAGLLFKGTGFYITDYGKDGKKDQRAATASAESKSDGQPAEGKTPESKTSESKTSESKSPDGKSSDSKSSDSKPSDNKSSNAPASKTAAPSESKPSSSSAPSKGASSPTSD